MNKQFKKYGKSKWINTRLSKPYKSRKAFAMVRAAQITAVSLSGLSNIIHAPDIAGKALAVVDHVLNSQKAINAAFEEIKKPL